MSTSRVTVSVVMPMHNAAAYVEAAVRSVLDQTWRELELVAVDDGSTDATPTRMQRLASEDARIVILQQRQQGVTGALRAGCDVARGRFIARLDADDLAMPDRLERQVTVFEAMPDLVLLGTAAEVFDDVGGRFVHRPSQRDALIRREMKRANTFVHSSIMMRRETYHHVGGYRGTFPHAEDYDLWLRLAEHGKVANLEDPLVRHRVHSGQVSSQALRQQALGALGAASAARRRRDGTARADDFAGALTEATLRNWGVGHREIEAAVVQAYLARVDTLVRLGQVDTAERLQQTLDELSLSRRGRRDAAAGACWILARRDVRAGRFTTGLPRLMRALAARPRHFSSRLVRNFGGRGR